MSEIKINAAEALRVATAISDAADELAEVTPDVSKGGTVSAALDLGLEKIEQLEKALKQYHELLVTDHDRVVSVVAEMQGLDERTAQKMVAGLESVVSTMHNLGSFFGTDAGVSGGGSSSAAGHLGRTCGKEAARWHMISRCPMWTGTGRAMRTTIRA